MQFKSAGTRHRKFLPVHVAKKKRRSCLRDPQIDNTDACNHTLEARPRPFSIKIHPGGLPPLPVLATQRKRDGAIEGGRHL